jgi:hypothetical protein
MAGIFESSTPSMSNRPCIVVLVTWRGLGFVLFTSLDAIAVLGCSEVEMSFRA